MFDSTNNISNTSVRLKPDVPKRSVVENKRAPKGAAVKEDAELLEVVQNNQSDKVAHLSGDKEVISREEDNEKSDETQTDVKTAERSLPFKRRYSIEDDRFVLRIYNKNGRLINKIPPGYLKIADSEKLDIVI